MLPVGQSVRYKPGQGTYGYEVETRLSTDGRIPAVVVGHSPTRVRVRMRLGLGRVVERCVDEDSLVPVDDAVRA